MLRFARLSITLSVALLVLLLPFSQADLTISDGGLAEGQSLFYSFDFSWGEEISYPGRAEIDVVTDGHGALIDGGPPIDLAGKDLHPWLSPEADEVFTRSDYTQLFRATANEMLWSVGVDTAVVDNVINHTKFWDAEVYSTRMDQLYYGPYMAQRSCGSQDSNDVDTSINICPTKTNSGSPQRDPLKKGWYLHFVTDPFVYRLVSVGCKTSCATSETCNAGHHRFYENFKAEARMADRYCGCECSDCWNPSPSPAPSPTPTPTSSPSPTPTSSPSPTPTSSPSPSPAPAPFPSSSPSPTPTSSPSPSPSPTPSPSPLCPEIGYRNFEFDDDPTVSITGVLGASKSIDDDGNNGCGSGNPVVNAVGLVEGDMLSGDAVIGLQVPGYFFDGILGYAVYQLNLTVFNNDSLLDDSPFESGYLDNQPSGFTYIGREQYERELVYEASGVGRDKNNEYVYTFLFLNPIQPSDYGSDGFGVAVVGQLQSDGSQTEDIFPWLFFDSGQRLQNCETENLTSDNEAGEISGAGGENYVRLTQGAKKLLLQEQGVRLCISPSSD